MLEAHAAGWTDERVATLKLMWNDGKSASEIRNELGGGITRSAVIGKAHRLKLEKRAPGKRRSTKSARPHGQKGQPKVNAIVRRASVAQALTAMPIPLDEETEVGIDMSKRIGLLDLNNHTCRWPVGPDTGAKQMFCGCWKGRDAGPYCPAHTGKAEAHR